MEAIQHEDNYDKYKTAEEYVNAMQDEGYEVVLPAWDTLQIDIDSSYYEEKFREHWEAVVKRNIPDAKIISETVSKSGVGKHITVQMPFQMLDLERIAWQAALGSDLVRETLALIRHRNFDFPCTLFVEKKQ